MEYEMMYNTTFWKGGYQYRGRENIDKIIILVMMLNILHIGIGTGLNTI